MIDSKLAPYAAFVLRLSLGLMYLSHALLFKVQMLGIDATAGFFASQGLPGSPAFTWLIILLEAVGGVLLITGVYARLTAVALLPILIGATWVHWPNGWVFVSANGGWEYPVYLIANSIAVYLLGSGAWTLKLPFLPQIKLPGEGAAA
jgi:putative oxidoreductase